MIPTPTEARRLAARFAPPQPPPEREPVKHWAAVRALLSTKSRTYRDVALALQLNIWHANTLMRRLAYFDLIEVARRGIPGKRATLYRLKKGGL
jgi:hypothetical protein